MKFLNLATTSLFFFAGSMSVAGSVVQRADYLQTQVNQLVTNTDTYENTRRLSQNDMINQIMQVRQSLDMLENEVRMVQPGSYNKYQYFSEISGRVSACKRCTVKIPVSVATPMYEVAIKAQTASYEQARIYNAVVEYADGSVDNISLVGTLNGSRQDIDMFLTVKKLSVPKSVKSVSFISDEKLDKVRIWGTSSKF